MTTEGDKNTLVFYYTLQNNTDFDYTIDDVSKITLLVKLEREKNLSDSLVTNIFERHVESLLSAAQKAADFILGKRSQSDQAD